MQLRFTTKYDDVDPLLGLPHHRRTRVRFSVNAAPVAQCMGELRGWFEGALAERLPRDNLITSIPRGVATTP